MSQLPINPLSPKEQQRRMGQMYVLLGNQVKSYHRQRHMGENSSVPKELAQELLESIGYTLDLAGGVNACGELIEALQVGQTILERKLEEARYTLKLVIATAPEWQTECRWEAVHDMESYLAAYDYLHLAHRSPDVMFYPMLVSLPDGIKGIDHCLFYLNVLWWENQIIAGVEPGLLESLWDKLPQDTFNQCEQLLVNGIGKVLLYDRLDSLTFTEEEYPMMYSLLKGLSAEELQSRLGEAAQRLNVLLDLQDENAIKYASAVVAPLFARLKYAIPNRNIPMIFI